MDPKQLLHVFQNVRKENFIGLIDGTHEIKKIEHIIDCDADPFVSKGWNVEEHLKMGNIKFDPSKIDLYLSEKQKNRSIKGHDLREELKGKKVLNANVADHLLKYPQIFPKKWKKDSEGKIRFIFFWGTIYYTSCGNLFVRYLYWGGGQLHSDRIWLDSSFNDLNPAAVLVI